MTHFVWADNVYLLSNSVDGLKKMIQSLSDVLNDRGLFWKPSSLRFMTNCDASLPSFTLHSMEPSRAIVPMEVKHIPHMDVLGARIDGKGSTRAAIAFRLQKAESAMRQFCVLLFSHFTPAKDLFWSPPAEWCLAFCIVVDVGAGALGSVVLGRLCALRCTLVYRVGPLCPQPSLFYHVYISIC